MRPISPQVARLVLYAAASPWLIAVAVAFTLAMSVVHDVARVVQRSREVGSRVELAQARMLAESAAMAALGAKPVGTALSGRGGVEVQMEGGALRLQARLPNGDVHAFEARLLPGSAPTAFGESMACAQSSPDLEGAARLPAADLPRLDESAIAGAGQAAAVPTLRRDPGLALLHLRAGTDADDFVFVPVRGAVDLGGAGELLVVPGHLWIESGERPLELRVPRDLVIVVQGNIYLQRSLRVRGAGRLVLVAAPGPTSTAFADLDGNGRWSDGDRLFEPPPFRGPIEGAGGVYCGAADSTTSVQCDASVVAFGELHVRVDSRFAGPLVLLHGITRLCPGVRVEAAGSWRFDAARERVPGFVTTGLPRPGFLQRRAGPSGNAAAMRQETLYLSSPGR